MLQIRCTKKMIAELGLTESILARIQPSGSLLGNWYAHAVRFSRQKAVIVVNEKTLYSVVLPGGYRNKPKEFSNAFCAGLALTLQFEGVSRPLIDKVLAEYECVEFTITDSRSILGSMNDLVSQYSDYVEFAGGLDMSNLRSITYKVNETPQKNLTWSNSHEALSRLFSAAI